MLDKYLSESFNTLIRDSYDYNQERQVNSPAWKVLRELYEKNYTQSTDIDQRIPKKIHQIWLGSPFPDKYKAWAESWQKFNPDWEYKLWTDANVNEVQLPDRVLFNSIRSMGQKSDYMRYHILNEFGGLYIDTDFECLKSFDPLSYLDFYTGIGFPGEVELYIGLIACSPNHSIIKNIVDTVTVVQRETHWRRLFEHTGSFFFTRKFLENVTKDTERVVAFPPGFFYPYPNNFRNKKAPYSYIKPCSFAIHHWEVSWLTKKREQ